MIETGSRLGYFFVQGQQKLYKNIIFPRKFHFKAIISYWMLTLQQRRHLQVSLSPASSNTGSMYELESEPIQMTHSGFRSDCIINSPPTLKDANILQSYIRKGVNKKIYMFKTILTCIQKQFSFAITSNHLYNLNTNAQNIF